MCNSCGKQQLFIFNYSAYLSNDPTADTSQLVISEMLPNNNGIAPEARLSNGGLEDIHYGSKVPSAGGRSESGDVDYREH